MVSLILNIDTLCVKQPIPAEYILTRGEKIHDMEENLERMRKIYRWLNILRKYDKLKKILKIEEDPEKICIGYDRKDDKLVLTTPKKKDDVYETIDLTIDVLNSWETKQLVEIDRQYKIIEELHRIGIISVVGHGH